MKRLKARPSLLPIALCVLIAVLLVKLGIMVSGALTPPDAAAPLDASEVQAGQPADSLRADVEKSAPSLVSESHAAPVPAEKPARNARASSASAADSLSFIQQRENELRLKEEQLREKEELLGKIEKEIEQKTRELLAIQKDIQAFRSEKQETQNTKVKGLSKIYGTMKPKEAARLMENLDEKLVMGIISTMTPDEAAAILSLMEVKKAAKISEALSGR